MRSSIRVGTYLQIILLELACQFQEIFIILIEQVAIVYNFLDVTMELGGSRVHFIPDVRLDGLEVHWLLDNF